MAASTETMIVHKDTGTVDTKISHDQAQVQTNLRVISDAIINAPIDTTDDLIFSHQGETLTIRAPIRTSGSILICAKKMLLQSAMLGNRLWYMESISQSNGGAMKFGPMTPFWPNTGIPDFEKITREFHQIRQEDRKKRQDNFSMYAVDTLTEAQKNLILEKDGVILPNSATAPANAPIRFKIGMVHLNNATDGGIGDTIGLTRYSIVGLTDSLEKLLRDKIPLVTIENHPNKPTEKLITYQIKYEALLQQFITQFKQQDINKNVGWKVTTSEHTVSGFDSDPNESFPAKKYSVSAHGPAGSKLVLYAKNHLISEAGFVYIGIYDPTDALGKAYTILKLDKAVGHIFQSMVINPSADASNLTAEILVCKVPQDYPNDDPRPKVYTSFSGSITFTNHPLIPPDVHSYPQKPEPTSNSVASTGAAAAATATASVQQPKSAPALAATKSTEAATPATPDQIVADAVKILQPEFVKITKEEQWKQQISIILDTLDVEVNPPAYPNLEKRLARIVAILGLLNQENLPLEKVLTQTRLCKAAIAAREALQKQAEQPQNGAPMLPLRTTLASKIAAAVPATLNASAFPTTMSVTKQSS